jgi:hypothetical protein
MLEDLESPVASTSDYVPCKTSPVPRVQKSGSRSLPKLDAGPLREQHGKYGCVGRNGEVAGHEWALHDGSFDALSTVAATMTLPPEKLEPQ